MGCNLCDVSNVSKTVVMAKSIWTRVETWQNPDWRDINHVTGLAFEMFIKRSLHNHLGTSFAQCRPCCFASIRLLEELWNASSGNYSVQNELGNTYVGRLIRAFDGGRMICTYACTYSLAPCPCRCGPPHPWRIVRTGLAVHLPPSAGFE